MNQIGMNRKENFADENIVELTAIERTPHTIHSHHHDFGEKLNCLHQI